MCILMQNKTQVVEIEKGFTENRFKQQKRTKSKHPKVFQPLQHSLLTAFIALIKARAKVGL